MSVFTSRVTKVLEIPHDAGQSVTIRKLAPRHLDQAQKAQQLKSLEALKDMGGAAIMRELRELRDPADEKPKAVSAMIAQADPVGGFDRVVLMEKSIASWSYDMPLTGESFADLDDDTQAFLAREILKLSKPKLFLSEDEAEGEKKSA